MGRSFCTIKNVYIGVEYIRILLIFVVKKKNLALVYPPCLGLGNGRHTYVVHLHLANETVQVRVRLGSNGVNPFYLQELLGLKYWNVEWDHCIISNLGQIIDSYLMI